MRRTVFGINITADGYCGHEDAIADEELHEYFAGLLRSADTILFGRTTYELMFPYWHTIAETQSETPAVNEFARTIDAIQKIVFSKTLKSVDMKNTTISRTTMETELQSLRNLPGRDIAIGSLSIASYLTNLRMIDEYHFVVHPIVAGKGPRLFEPYGIKERFQLTLLGSKTFGSGVIALHYRMGGKPE
jgi:dihydrofolate reductase